MKEHPNSDRSKHTVKTKSQEKKSPEKNKDTPETYPALRGLSKSERRKVIERALRKNEGKKPLKDVSKNEGFESLKNLTPSEQQKIIQKALSIK